MDQATSFGGFVRQRRREMDLTQEELARRVGCAAITLRKIEADDLRASVQIAERLALALGIPLEERAEFVRWARSVRPAASELPPVTPPPSLEEIGREDLTGRAIRGYALAERIGMGGMGSVYRAVQPNVEREVAIKIILPAFADHPDFIRRFEAEAQLVARLEHPHIVPLYDYWREPGVAFLVMRLLRGGNIQNLLKQGPLSVETTAQMLEQICFALNAAHRMGVVHRDLKPANVLLDEDSNAYLADFGIAKNLGNPDFENQTHVDAMLGSPQYMSPEQIRSFSIRPQTDIYCLGVMLYEMLTGTLPFNGPTPFDLIHHHINTPMPPLAAHRSGLPAALDAVITRATAKDPNERFSDVLSFFNDFRQSISRIVDAHPMTITYEEEESDIEIINPFKGLRAFSEADAENFFGRETLIQQLLARLGEGGDLSRFLAVIGPSGSGKSSVVRAGLIPALRRGGLPGSENWFVVDLLPGKHPFEELEAALLRVAVNPPPSLLGQLKDGNRGLLRAVHRILPSDETVELVLVIDQFEELFTLVEDEVERALLLEAIATAVMDERSRLRVIVTLRADFTDKPLRYVDFGEMMNRRFEFILPLTADEVERAVAGPAQRAGLRLEKGLVSTIIREAGNQPGTLPLLQHALSELFERREGRMLTNKAFREIGGVLGALVRSAEVLYALLDKPGKSATRQLYLRLVTLGEGTEDTRRRVLQEELEDLPEHNGQLSAVIAAFGRARLLSFDHDPITRGATIEVAHEALLREWTRLREWLNESRADVRLQRQLATAANEWQKANRDASFLLTGARLEHFEGWAANTTVALTHEERAFLDASVRERDQRAQAERARQERELENLQKLADTEKKRAEEQARSAGQLRKRAVYLAGAFVVALVMAVAALFFARQAQTTSRLATSRELAAAAISNLDEDPERSLLLALQAESTSHTSEAENALHRSILASRTRIVLTHDAQVWSITYSPDGKRIATASQDKTAKIWDANTGQLLLTLTGHTESVNGIVFSPDGRRIATTSDDHTAKVWDASTGDELLTFSGHTDWVARIAFSPDGTRLVTTSADETAKVWDTDTGQELLTFSGHGRLVWDVAFNPDGKRVATCGEDGFVRVWDVISGKELLTLPVEGGRDMRGVAFSPDGTRVAVASDGLHRVKVWDATTGEVLLSTNLGYTEFPVDIVFNPDGNLAATAGGDEPNAKVWDTITGDVLYTLSGHTSGIAGVAFSPDGTRLATASWDGTARVWDITPARESLFIPRDLQAEDPDSDWTFDVRYSPDGTRILTDYPQGNAAKLWDSISGKELLTFEGHADFLDYSPDGKMIAASSDKTIVVWDAKTGKQLVTLVGHTDYINSIDFSGDGTLLASAGLDGTVRIWDLASGKALFTLQEPGLYFFSVAYSPDGTRLAAGDGFGLGIVWDATTGEKLFTVSFDDLTIFGAAFSPDGKRLALANRFGTIRIWDAVTGNELLTLKGNIGRVNAVTFSPDGKFIATANDDGTARVWDAITGVNLLTLPVESTGAGDVSFSPDGKRLAVGGASGIYVFVLPIDEAVALARSRLTRALTIEECQKYLHMEQCPSTP
jgi:WD40 repeat protein/serine/threonine protein kinase/DNA-binding XRE family transcriptional regulator